MQPAFAAKWFRPKHTQNTVNTPMHTPIYCCIHSNINFKAIISELGSQKLIDDLAFQGRNGPGRAGPGLKIWDWKRAGPESRVPTAGPGRAGPGREFSARAGLYSRHYRPTSPIVILMLFFVDRHRLVCQVCAEDDGSCVAGVATNHIYYLVCAVLNVK